MSFGSTISTDPAVEKVITDAKALGDTIASDALVFCHSVIGHVSGATPGIIADVSAAALAAFYDAVPSNFRGTVQAIVGGIATNAVAPIDALASNELIGILGLATTRIESFFSTFMPTTTTASTTTKPA